tara:strand:- start:203 stop:2437 length:2235 start_codon:yes stop_codon:yes gene_type:complete
VAAVFGLAALDQDDELDLFPTDRVLEVELTVDQADWDKIRFQTRNFFEVLQRKRKTEVISHPYVFVPARLRIDGQDLGLVGIRKKGFIGSQNAGRPSLKVKLDHIEQGHAIGGLSRLTFNNNNQDITLMSQTMGYALFNAAGSPASRCAYARISVNGKPIGLYTHVETIHKPMLERGFGNARGTLYEGSVVDFFDGWENSFELKTGKDKMDRLSRVKMKELIEILKRPAPGEKTDPASVKQGQELERAIGRIVDLDSFYTFWAIESLLGFWDGYSANCNNYFVYHNPKTDRFHFIPWGGDCMFEKKSKLPVDPRAPLSVKTKGLIAHKLYQIPAGRARYLQTLQQVMTEHWNEDALLAETRRIESLVTPFVPPAQKAAIRFDGIRQFIRSRRNDIESETSNGMPVYANKPPPPPLLDAPGGGRRRPQNTNTIFHAAKTGNLKAIRKYLDEGADVNGRDEGGVTSLSFAALSGQADAISLLIKRGADPSLANRDRNTPLHGAAFLGRIEAVRVLIDAGADINARNNRKETPLDSCGAPWNDGLQGIVQFVGGMLNLDIDMEQVKSGRPKVVAILGDKGGLRGDQLDATRRMTIWQAAKAGKTGALKNQLAKRPDLSRLDSKGISPLGWAALGGHVDATRLLIEAGADVNQKNRDGSTPLHGAAFLGRIEVVQALLEYKASVNPLNGQGETPLGTVATPWSSGTRRVTRFYSRLLGIRVDLKTIEAARPKISELLRQHGGKPASEL